MHIHSAPASSLVDERKIDGIVGSVLGGRKPKEEENERIRSGSKSVDDALGGGVRTGCLVGMNVCVDSRTNYGMGVGRELYQALLIHHLIPREATSAPPSIVYVIDTNGDFDVYYLYNLVQREVQVNSAFRNAMAGLSPEEIAKTVLDRVFLMRVFDMIGMMEAVQEIRENLDKEKLAREKEEVNEESTGRAESTIGGEEHVVEKDDEVQREERVIADSEDEYDDDEMLFDAPDIDAYIQAYDGNLDTFESPQDAQLDPTNTSAQSSPASPKTKNILILIDNFSDALTPLLNKDREGGERIAHAILHTLHTLAHSHSPKTHKITPLILNPAPSPSPPPYHRYRRSDTRQPFYHDPSIFFSVRNIPENINLLAPYLDSKLLVSRAPKREQDAKLLAGYVKQGSRVFRGVEWVGVVEVVGDREGRTGTWGVFDLNGVLS